MDCYTKEILYFEDPTFKMIKTTYLLTMKNSKRRAQYLKQLQKYKPTSEVIILHNKGYKQCAKDVWVTDSAKDLFHANLFALEQHFSRNDSPVLILEDDVEFLDVFFSKSTSIETFLQNNVDLYSLGSIPFLSMPTTFSHIRMYLGAIAHAFIYTRSGADKIKKMKISDTNFFHDFHVIKNLKAYIGIEPSAIQVFGKTENSTLWDFGGIVLKYNQFFGDQLFPIHHFLGVFGGLFIIVIILCFLIVRIIKKIMNKKLRS